MDERHNSFQPFCCESLPQNMRKFTPKFVEVWRKFCSLPTVVSRRLSWNFFGKSAPSNILMGHILPYGTTFFWAIDKYDSLKNKPWICVAIWPFSKVFSKYLENLSLLTINQFSVYHPRMNCLQMYLHHPMQNTTNWKHRSSACLTRPPFFVVAITRLPPASCSRDITSICAGLRVCGRTLRGLMTCGGVLASRAERKFGAH